MFFIFLTFIHSHSLAWYQGKRYDIRKIQELSGHKSVETTIIYTHVIREFKTKARSPLDDMR
ncbi:MAG: tyrosine-type recombinase/integrase [Spirochaetaceae bacterium]|nr:tyrosine-type recombinase/integrase [Spirochaetaceae bacterium]